MLYYLLLFYLSIQLRQDPFANLNFEDDCETLKKKNPNQKI